MGSETDPSPPSGSPEDPKTTRDSRPPDPAPPSSETPPLLSTPTTASPPVLPPPQASLNRASSEADPASEPILQGRLHPTTFIFAVWNSIKGLLIWIFLLLFVTKRPGMLMFVLIFPVMALLGALVRYARFSYRLEAGELITRDGLLEIRERHVSLHRVQDIRIEQGILHRLFGVAEVFVETAGGQGVEASFSVVSMKEAERFRAAVFDHRSKESDAGDPDTTQIDILHQVPTKDLVLAGLTSNRAAYIVVFALALLGQADHFIPEDQWKSLFESAASAVESWMESSAGMDWLWISLGVIGVAVAALMFSVIGTLVLFRGFTLSRRANDLHRYYGWFTKRSASVPLHRIQLLKVEQSWLRRWLGLSTLRADTAGNHPSEDNQESDGRDVMVPVIPVTRVQDLIRVILPGASDFTPEWQRVSPCMIRRQSVIGFFVLLPITVAWIAVTQSLIPLWILSAELPIVILSVYAFRHLGYSDQHGFFQARKGWLNRSRFILPTRNIQSVLVRQSPFDRRYGVATLQLDTAGQAFTGGAPELNNVPWDDAVPLAGSLARQAAHAATPQHTPNPEQQSLEPV